MILTEKDVKRARDLSIEYHNSARRENSGEPYSVHPQGVVDILQSSGYRDPVIQCIAFLHDVIEDAEVIHKTLEEQFGYEVSNGVYILSKNTIYPQQIQFHRENYKVGKDIDDEMLKKIMYRGRIILARPKIKLVKVADGVHNTKDLVATFQKNEARGRRMLEEVKNFHLKLLRPEDVLLRQQLEGNIRHFEEYLSLQ